MNPLLYALAQDADENARATGAAVGGLAASCCFFVFAMLIAVVIVVGLWKIFTKARQPGWAALIPIFNIYIICVIAGKPAWWIILFFIPLVNIIIAFIVWMDVAKYFGKSPAYAIGIVLLPIIFIPLLGFSDAQYSGPAKPFSV
ncbi:MAG: DUF5684 domain-containing protein [Phycisphaerae bacterium]